MVKNGLLGLLLANHRKRGKVLGKVLGKVRVRAWGRGG